MLYRFQLDLAIPQEAYDSLSTTTKQNVRDAIRKLKSYAVKINAGQPNEEMTVKATYHRCHHDQGLPCEPEIDV